MSIAVAFDKAVHRPGEPIQFQVVVEDEPTTVTETVTVTGSVVLPGQTTVLVSGSTTVADEITYGAFTADGYTVEQDQADPSRYIATPTAG